MGCIAFEIALSLSGKRHTSIKAARTATRIRKPNELNDRVIVSMLKSKALHRPREWEFDDAGLMSRSEASINDIEIAEKDRRFHWPLGPRPADVPGLAAEPF